MKNGNYELVKAPEDYPGKRYRGKYCYEHHLVYWKHTGIIPKKDEVVHHENEDKRDNKFKNLKLKKKIIHDKEHSTTGKTMVTLTCTFCEDTFKREARQTYNKKKGQKDFYCDRSCMAKHFGRGGNKQC